MTATFSKKPDRTDQARHKKVFVFDETNEATKNVDEAVVASFGSEWARFHDFDFKEIERMGEMYFDIVDEKIISKSSYIADFGCGTGRWSYVLAPRVGFVEAIDPSEAIFAADELLSKTENVRLSQATIDNVPFADETFDFAMSVGVLHHIPDTQKALADCVKKVKIGGHFYVYLYYALDNRSSFFRAIHAASEVLRLGIARLPQGLKEIVCDLLAATIYLPFVLIGRFFRAVRLENVSKKLPLHGYIDRTFYVMRNDALDRFGTALEQRFSKSEVETMMQNAGLEAIRVSPNLPFWHAIGRRAR